MQQSDLMDMLVLEKKVYGKLNEVMDITNQLAEATDRRDQVSVQMLVVMRQEPINQLQQANDSLAQKRSQLDAEDAARVEALLHGASGEDEFERMLTEQSAANRRLLERVVALDRRVSTGLGGENSFYAAQQEQ